MRIAIAGGAGFIGSHLCARLLSDGHTVLSIDAYLTGRPSTIADLQHDPHFQVIEHDIRDAIDLEPVDAIFNLASPASPPQYRQLAVETLLTNALGTRNLLDWAERSNARFVQASTSEVYGDPEVHPQPETYHGNVNPIGERACYDEGKRFAEALTMEYARSRDLDIRIARIFNTYGPAMQIDDGRVVSNFIAQAVRGAPLTIFGSGAQTRSFCYVADTVDALVRLMLTDGLSGEVVNIGNPTEQTVRSLAEVVGRMFGREPAYAYAALPEDDPRRRCPDVTKAHTLLGWEPTTSLEAGLQLTVEDFKRRLAIAGS